MSALALASAKAMARHHRRVHQHHGLAQILAVGVVRPPRELPQNAGSWGCSPDSAEGKKGAVGTPDKVLMPVLDGHPDVFDRVRPVRMADIDRNSRLRLDAAARHIQDVGQDHVHEQGFDESHPLWIVRRTMIDLIRPIKFQDMLRLRRWCSGTSTRWREIRVRIDGGKGGRRNQRLAAHLNTNTTTSRDTLHLRSAFPLANPGP
jgi:hypothetical protein